MCVLLQPLFCFASFIGSIASPIDCLEACRLLVVVGVTFVFPLFYFSRHKILSLLINSVFSFRARFVTHDYGGATPVDNGVGNRCHTCSKLYSMKKLGR